MKSFVFALCCFSFSAHASSLDIFYQGFQKAFYLKNIERGLETSEHIRLTKFGMIGRVLSPDASATYNDKINTISLDQSLLVLKDRKYEIIDPRVMLNPGYSGFSTVATIFHELGHAEMDVFIKNEVTLSDLSLKYFYKTKLRPLYKKYFKGINPWTVFHEHFAYYRTDLIETLSFDMMDLMGENGWHAQRGTCYLTPQLKRMKAEGVSLEEFLKIRTSKIKNYKDITPGYIFVRGKDLNLADVKGADADVLKEAHTLFWSYHKEFYGFPKNISEIVAKMNDDSVFNKLRTCRENLYLSKVTNRLEERF